MVIGLPLNVNRAQALSEAGSREIRIFEQALNMRRIGMMRYFGLIFVLVLSLGLAACGKDEEAPPDTKAPIAPQPAPPPQTPRPPQAPDQPQVQPQVPGTPGGGTPSSPQSQTPQVAPPGAPVETEPERVTYQRQLENQIDELDKKTGELRVRALAAREEVREENTRLMDALLEKREEAVDRLQDMKAQAGKSWDEARAKADAALNEYRRTYEGTASRIR